jgi:propionate kinase
VKNGQSVDTSMGMTPLEGLVMGTRCGDLDFGAAAYIARCTGQTIESLYKMVNNEAGLFGLSGLSSDCRTLQEARSHGDPRATSRLMSWFTDLPATLAPISLRCIALMR